MKCDKCDTFVFFGGRMDATAEGHAWLYFSDKRAKIGWARAAWTMRRDSWGVLQGASDDVTPFRSVTCPSAS